MNTTYLINKAQGDGTIRLSVATLEEWVAVVSDNKSMPADQQRYFIVDWVMDNQGVDRMVIETSATEYRKWNRERMASARNRAWKKEFQVLSIDIPINFEGAVLDLREVLKSEERVEDYVCTQIMLEELKDALAAWKPWANDLLEYYLQGEQRSCTGQLSQKYGVSPQVVRKYKRQFDEFIKKFLGGVSF